MSKMKFPVDPNIRCAHKASYGPEVQCSNRATHSVEWTGNNYSRFAACDDHGIKSCGSYIIQPIFMDTKEQIEIFERLFGKVDKAT